MPMLDVSFLTVDPMLADTFNVARRTEVVGADGRPAITSVTTTGVLGVVTQEDPSKLTRSDDSQIADRCISVVTQFALRGVTSGFQPDLIIWNGTTYLVNSVKPYSRFGAGMYEALAGSMTAADVPQ